ncbi:MAG: hypothetical protein ACYCS8_02340 [Acidithiobacillus sp.]
MPVPVPSSRPKEAKLFRNNRSQAVPIPERHYPQSVRAGRAPH